MFLQLMFHTRFLKMTFYCYRILTILDGIAILNQQKNEQTIHGSAVCFK